MSSFGGGFFGAPGVVQQKTTKITPAEFKALSGAPITLITSPGANSVIVPIYIVSTIEFVSQSFNCLAGYNANIQNLGQDITWAVLPQLFCNEGQNAVRVQNLPAAGGFGTTVVPLDATLLGADVVLQTPNADPLAGDSLINITIAYIVVTFP